MFSEALRILDRNMAELMVDRMKDEIVDLKEQNDEKYAEIQKTEKSFFETELPGCLGRLHEKYPEKKLYSVGLCSADRF